MKINKVIETIEEKYGKIEKSNFTLAYWIHQSNYFIEIYKAIYPDRNKLRRMYIEKNKCVGSMLRSGLNDIKIYKPSDDEYKWLLVLNNRKEGLEYTAVVPYLYYKELVNIHSLETTDINQDKIYMNGKEFKIDIYKKGNNGYRYCIENMKKSRVKMHEKLTSKNKYNIKN